MFLRRRDPGSPGRGKPRPCKISIPGSVAPVADVDKVAFDCGSGGHERADEMGASVFSLAALEIAIRRAGAALVRLKNVVIHADTHAASSIAPFESGVAENFVEAFGFGLCFHAARAGNDERLLQRF